MDTVTSSFSMDNLLASKSADYPVKTDIETIKIGQSLSRGTVLGKEDGTHATKTASNDGTYAVDDGDTIVIDVDNGGNATATINGTAGYVVDTTTYTGGTAGSVTDTTTYTGGTAGTVTDTTTYDVADQDGKTEKVTVDGGSEQTVTFPASTTTNLHVAAALNNQLVGAHATVTGGQVVLTSDSVGVDSSIAIGTGTCDLTWDTPVAGTGGLADQDTLTEKVTIDGGTEQTVTFSGVTTEVADVAAQMAAQLTGCTVAVVGGQVKITSDSVGVDSSVAIGTGTCALSWDTPVAGTGGLADQDTLTEKVTIDGGSEQTVTFSGVTTEVADVAAQMAAQLTGCTVAVVGGQVKITSDKIGTDSSVAIGTGTCALSWDTPVAGTGDAADLSAVTVAEVKTVLEADITGITVTAVGDAFKIESDTYGTTSELDFKSGNLLTTFGFSVEAVVGTGGSGHMVPVDKDGEDGSESPHSVLAQDIDATSEATEGLVYTRGEFDSDELTFASGTAIADVKDAMQQVGLYVRDASNAVS